MTTTKVPTPNTELCECGHDAALHDAESGVCSVEPEGFWQGGCPCYRFVASPIYVWNGPDVVLARHLERLLAFPKFFIFESEPPAHERERRPKRERTLHVLFETPMRDDGRFRPPDDLGPVQVRFWCRTAPDELPGDLAAMSARAREDDAAAAVYLDALMERGLVRATTP